MRHIQTLGHEAVSYDESRENNMYILLGFVVYPRIIFVQEI
jgi:hypothetical protein